jgi:hypothetical protein
MAITWLVIVASLVIGGAALLVFILAVKRDYCRNIEDIKYQAFWSDMEGLIDSTAARRTSRIVREDLCWVIA